MTEGKSQDVQRKYNAASVLCNSLDTVVPSAMSFEQKKFNEKLMAAVGDVDKFVADRLKYDTVDELCNFFGKEQIDAIATAIYQHEVTGDSIIVADQTGVGKGRIAAGLIRYGILGLKKIPIFFTEKPHLISDIYRDLINIGFDTGVPYKNRVETKTKGKEYSDKEIEELIFADLKENDDIQVDYDFDDEIKDVSKFLRDEANEDTLAEIVELYSQMLLESGGEESRVSYQLNPNYKQGSIEALKSGRTIVKPLLLNSPMKVKDTDGNILYESNNSEQNEIFKSNIIPSEYKLIATSYSQISSPYTTKDKKQVLKDKVKTLLKYSKDTVLILDESHNASGMRPDGSKSNTAEMMFKLVKNSAMTTFLSATYAKRADNMPLYALTTAIREAGLSEKDLIGAFVKGGNALQEATSAELVRNGELLRREKAISGKTTYEYMDESSEAGLNQISKLDTIAMLFKKVRLFETEIAEKINAESKGRGIEKGTVKFAGNTGRFGFLLFNFFIIGLKVRQTADQAIKNLKEGKKPVIAIGNTMESAFNKMQKTFMLNAGKSDFYKTGEAMPNDFKLYCAYLLKYTFRIKVETVLVNDDGSKEPKSETFDISNNEGMNECNIAISEATSSGGHDFASEIVETMRDKYNEALSEIMSITTGIPLSPIDMIMDRIEKAGFSIEEITGRKRKIQVVNEGNKIEYIISDRAIRKTEDIVRDYNQNKIDALIINQAGAAGLSMHALPNPVVTKVPDLPPTSLEPRNEVKQRCMIVTQMELDINKEVQKIGRINRTGQVYPPEYTYLISAIPSESRLSSMMEKKLRSLSANVSSNQTQFSYQFTADDFFSDIAVAPCNSVLSSMGRRDLAGKEGEVTSGKGIYDLTKALYFADYFTQKDFYTSFSKALTDEVVSLKSQGLYTGVMENKDYAAKSLGIYPFFIGDNEARTSFGRHVFIDKSEVQIVDEKNIDQFVKEKIKSNFTINVQYSSDTYAYPDHENYQKKSFEFLDKYDELYVAAQKEAQTETDDRISSYKKQIEEYEIELKKFGLLDEVVKLKERINELKSRHAEIVESITEALTSGGDATEMMATVQERTATAQRVKKELDELTITVEKPKYKEAYENRHDYDDINRNKKSDLRQIELIEERLERDIKVFEEKRKVIALVKEYIGKIGNVFNYTVYDESEDYDDVSGEYKFNYDKVSEDKVVLYGVNWDAHENITSVSDFGHSMTLGNITLKLAKVVGTTTTNLFAFLGAIREDLAKRGKRNRIEFVDTNKKYDQKELNSTFWNTYLSSVDTGRMEQRYFLTGSLLKGFVAGYQNGYSGTILKYNTNENKVRIGIELSEQAKKALESRYSEDTELSYPIFFDANPANTKLFIKDYLWMAYNAVREGDESYTAINQIKGLLSNDNGRIGFEVTASGTSRVAVLFAIDGIQRDYQVGNSGEITDSQEDLFNKVKATFAFSKPADALGFLALSMKIAKSKGIDMDDIVALKDSDSKVNTKHPSGISIENNFQPSYNVKSNTSITSKVTPYVNFFPTNIVKFQEKMEESRWGASLIYEFGYSVKIPFELFEAITEHLAELRTNMILCTSSAWYEASDANFIMEQFDDDIQIPEEVDGGESTEFVSPLTEEVKEKVDLLINNLMNSVSEGIMELI
jgi:hypothetical protein